MLCEIAQFKGIKF